MSKTVSESDVYLFAGITGDFNSAHVDQMTSSQAKFQGCIAHGILSTGYTSSVLAMKLPCPGTIYLEQHLKFVDPVRFGDTIAAKVTVSEIIPQKNIITLYTICTNQTGNTVLKGQATVL